MKKVLIAMLALVAALSQNASAQSVGNYTETATGNTRAAVGVTLVGNGTNAAVGAPADNQGVSNGLYISSQNLNNDGTLNWRSRGDNNGTVVQPALSANFWSYAAATGGIVNTTTAVTIKAAATGRNYLCTLNIGHDTLGAATEFAVRDGAAGAVLFRMKLQTAAQEGASEVNFSPCLRGSVATLMEVVTLTASVTGGVFVNASGYSAN